MNAFENIPAESEFRVEMTIQSDEGDLVIDQDTPLGELLDDQDTRIEPEETPLGEYYGDGSGTDDLADYNANEADDYLNE